MKNKIRIAVYSNNYKIDYCNYSMLEEILLNPQIEVVNFFVNQILKNKSSNLFSQHKRIEEQIFKIHPNAQEKKGLENLIPDSKIIKIDYQQNSDEIRRYIKEQNLDYIIKLDHTIPDNSFEKIINGGILFLYYGNLKSPITNIPGAREMLTNQDFMEANLMFLSNKSELNVLKTIKVSTDKMSILRGTNNLLWTASKLIPRALQGFIDKGLNNYLKKGNMVPDFNVEDTRNIWKLKDRDLAISLIKKYSKKINQLIYSRIHTAQWMLLFTFNQYNPLQGFSPKNFTKIISPKDRFWADPFIYRRDNQYYVFFEELVYKDIKGHISVMALNEDGSYSQPKCILKKEYHLSYPFLIEDNNELYMIPETKENKTIEIYRCVKFPYVWEFEMNLMNNTVAVDTTMLKKDNKYWMFTNIQERNGASVNNELFIFYSDNLLSQNWHPHLANPVVSDVSKARSAGNIFEFKNELYRPAQNCSKHYGYAMSVNRITHLTEEKYEEEEVSTILPNWDKNITSTHTFNQLNNLTVIDGEMQIKKKG